MFLARQAVTNNNNNHEPAPPAPAPSFSIISVGAALVAMILFILTCALPITVFTSGSTKSTLSYFQVCVSSSSFDVCQDTSSIKFTCEAFSSSLKAGAAMSILATLSSAAAVGLFILRLISPTGFIRFDQSSGRTFVNLAIGASLVFGSVDTALAFVLNFGTFCGISQTSSTSWNIGPCPPIAIAAVILMIISLSFETCCTVQPDTSHNAQQLRIIGYDRGNLTAMNHNAATATTGTVVLHGNNPMIQPNLAIAGGVGGGTAGAVAPPPPEDQYFQHAGWTYWRQGSTGRTFWWDQNIQQWHECQN